MCVYISLSLYIYIYACNTPVRMYVYNLIHFNTWSISITPYISATPYDSKQQLDPFRQLHICSKLI